MTWAKTGAEFPDECGRDSLSDAAYRTHHEAISWAYSVEQMSLRVPKRLMRHIAYSEDYQDACLELVLLGYWQDRDSEWEIVHHAEVIRSSIGAKRRQREAERLKKRRQRGKRKPRDVPPGQTPGTSPVTTTVTSPRDIPRDPDRQSGTSLGEAREVRAHSNGGKPQRGESDLTPGRTDPRDAS